MGEDRSPSRREVAAPRTSWVDVATSGLDRLPGPPWLAYLGLGLVLVVLQVSLLAAAGLPAGPFAVYFSLAGIYALALLHYLARAAGNAFDRFESALAQPHHGRAETWRAELTSLPPGPTAGVSIAAAALALGVLVATGPIDQQLLSAGLPSGSVAITFNAALYIFNWAATGAVLYRIVHQSRQISRIYGYARVDLFRQSPLHTFSWLGAQSVVALALMFYAPAFLLPEVGDPAIWLAVRLGIGVLLAIVFVWPLLGVHRILVAEQARLLARSQERSQEFYDELHERLGRGERGVADPTRNEIDTLEREQKALRAVSTWPWSAEAIPTVVGAIFLPLLLSILLSIFHQLYGP